MAFRSKRRKPRVIWLPQDRFNRIGVLPGVGATLGTQQALGTGVLLAPGLGGSSTTSVYPLVGDPPANIALAGAAGTSLSDLISSGYRLRRVVGKLFVQVYQSNPAATYDPAFPNNFIVTAGIIVLRVDDLGLPINPTTELYSTQILDSTMDPWVWRRSWRLANQINLINSGAPNSANVSTAALPGNSYAGSVADGPHVDQKTARVVSNEERLFLVMTVVSLDGGDAQTTWPIEFQWDFRFVATLRSNMGNRRNASR